MALFDIFGKMSTSMLSLKTNYAAYLVYKLTKEAFGFERPSLRASVGTTGGGGVYEQSVGLDLLLPAVQQEQQDHVVLSQQQQHTSRPKEREDGWLEIELGPIFNGEGEDDELQFGLKEVKSFSVKSGLIVAGIEIMPTRG